MMCVMYVIRVFISQIMNVFKYHVGNSITTESLLQQQFVTFHMQKGNSMKTGT